MNDPIVEQIREYREQYAAKFGYDLAAICRDLRAREATCARRVVSRPPKTVPAKERVDTATGRVTNR
jgi:hypothetical protein